MHADKASHLSPEPARPYARTCNGNKQARTIIEIACRQHNMMRQLRHLEKAQHDCAGNTLGVQPADVGHQYSPIDTPQKACDVGVDPPALSPQLHCLQGYPEVSDLVCSYFCQDGVCHSASVQRSHALLVTVAKGGLGSHIQVVWHHRQLKLGVQQINRYPMQLQHRINLQHSAANCAGYAVQLWHGLGCNVCVVVAACAHVASIAGHSICSAQQQTL